MADPIRNYFDAKVPVEPGEGRLGGGAQVVPTWQGAWTELSKQLFVVLPNQLDRARVNRNKFLSAVK